MPQNIIPLPIAPRPGVVKNNSPRTVEGRWIAVEKFRFVGGKPQKIGGWGKLTSSQSDGAPRTLHAWRDNSSIEQIGAGTYKRLYIVDTTWTWNDITPLSSSGTLGANPFATTNGSVTVTVTHTAHGRAVGSLASYSGAAAAGGITINGSYPVVSVPTANTYTIEHSSAATSTATGGGASVAYEYPINIGTDVGVYGLGYGIGTYGAETYGGARSASTIFVEPRIWSIDHFGQIGLFSYNEGRLYSWNPSGTPLYQRAALVSDSPTNIRYHFVTPERFDIALCASMTLIWCSQGDYATWTPASSNTAGSRGVTEGTKLVGGRTLGGGLSLIWSDAALYLHQYTGSSLVFDTRLAGRNCGLISPSAAVTVGSTAYWMGHERFFMFDGAVRPLPGIEDIRKYVFDNLNKEQGYLCAAMYCPQFNEVWFFYVALSASNPGLYAIYSIDDPCFSIGTLTRVAGTHFQHGDTRGIWADSSGDLFRHENGHDNDGAAIDATITMAPAGLDKGLRNMAVTGFEPDFHEQSGTVSITFNAWDRIRATTDTPTDTDALSVATTDGLIDPRISGRYMGFTVRSNTLGGYLRFGTPTAYVKARGSKR